MGEDSLPGYQEDAPVSITEEPLPNLPADIPENVEAQKAEEPAGPTVTEPAPNAVRLQALNKVTAQCFVFGTYPWHGGEFRQA